MEGIVSWIVVPKQYQGVHQDQGLSEGSWKRGGGSPADYCNILGSWHLIELAPLTLDRTFE